MAAAAFFISLICYIALIRQVTLIRLVATGSALGVLFTTKLVAFFILPTMLALLIFRSTDSWSLHLFGRSVTRRWHKSLVLIGIVLILGGYVVGVVWGVYGFQYRDSRGDEISFSNEMETHFISVPVLDWAAAHKVLPEAYLIAINKMLTTKNTGYLKGEISYEGWWWYFPYALFVKTPIPSLLCFLFAIGCAAVQVCRLSDKSSADVPDNVLEWMGLTLSVLFYIGIAMISSYNVGIRLMLSIHPCMISLVGLSTPHFGKSKILRYTLAFCLYGLGLLLFIRVQILCLTSMSSLVVQKMGTSTSLIQTWIGGKIFHFLRSILKSEKIKKFGCSTLVQFLRRLMVLNINRSLRLMPSLSQSMLS